MKQYRNVRGSQEKVANLEINIDTVYIRENIIRIEADDFIGWQYDEFQYSLREYQEKLGNKTNEIKHDNEIVAETVMVSLDDLQILAETLMLLLDEINSLKGGN